MHLSKILSCSILLWAISALPAKDSAPNILLFLTDDESAFDQRSYGFTEVPRPGFERVADQGIFFRNAYSSAPSCGPARGSLLTGRHFWQNEQMAFIQGFLPKEIPIFTDILRKHGYEIANTGKRHGPAAAVEGSWMEEDVVGTSYMAEKMESVPENIRPDDYAGNFEAFLKDRDAEKPFFFWAGVIEPHYPWGSENYKLLKQNFGIGPETLFLPPAIHDDTQAVRQWWGGYLYAMCYADAHLVRMMASLEQAGELENTIIVVTADNGAYLPAGAPEATEYRGKASPYDYGVRVPLAIMWPEGIKTSGRVVEDFVSFADIAPTFLELAGVAIPHGMTGTPLNSIFKTSDSGMVEGRDFMRTGMEWHGEFDPVSRSFRSIRKDSLSYLVHYENVDDEGEPLSNEALTRPASEELYDLKSDPWQMNNLVNHPEYADTLDSMRRLYIESGHDMNDPRVTGEMDLFKQTRQYVQKRKKVGYRETRRLPFEGEN